MKVGIKNELTGRILDIGGGGEGVIGRVYGAQVTTIDISPFFRGRENIHD